MVRSNMAYVSRSSNSVVSEGNSYSFSVEKGILDSSLISPEIELPCQFYERSSMVNMSGEKKLMLAVLEEGINTFIKNAFSKGINGRLFSEADYWFKCRDKKYPFSYEGICETLDLNADCIRKGLYALIGQRREMSSNGKCRPHKKIRLGYLTWYNRRALWSKNKKNQK